MHEAESIQPSLEFKEPTTVLDAYEAVMSLGEAAVSKLVARIWNDLPPEEREEVWVTAQTIHPSIALSAQYAQQLLVFNYVNRSSDNPFVFSEPQDSV